MNTREEYKNNLLNFDLQSFLKEFEGATALALKKKFPDTYKLLAAQLALYPKAKEKLPRFTANYCYLSSKSFEQSSSEATAGYKASLLSGSSIIDLTGGLGIDDIAFAGTFDKVISVDTDDELNQLAEVNFQKLGINNIERITAKAEDFIKQDLSADLIYIDADRRQNSSGKKAITLHDSSPDIPAMLNRLFEISEKVLVKLSPLIDITYLKKNLPGAKEIRVVSLKNEVKEILVLLENNFIDEPVIVAVDIKNDGHVWEFNNSNRGYLPIEPGEHKKYFFEPGAALIKSGLVEQYAASNGLAAISENNVFLISDNPCTDFFGRAFEIVGSFEFSKSALKKYLTDHRITQANVSCRNFPVKPEEIKRTFKLTDGGEDYFFFTSGNDINKLVYHCRKIAK